MDYPREELLKRADAYAKQYGYDKIKIHFKFTCEKCGERCMFQEPSILFERGDCHNCGHNMEVKEGGFAALINLK